MAVKLDRVEDAKYGGGSGAADKDHHDGDEHQHLPALPQGLHPLTPELKVF